MNKSHSYIISKLSENDNKYPGSVIMYSCSLAAVEKSLKWHSVFAGGGSRRADFLSAERPSGERKTREVQKPGGTRGPSWAQAWHSVPGVKRDWT